MRLADWRSRIQIWYAGSFSKVGSVRARSGLDSTRQAFPQTLWTSFSPGKRSRRPPPTRSLVVRGEVGNGGGLLIFVDGVRIGYSDGSTLFDELNPNDIESIEVIKGPAAEGVIQIVTKEAAADSA